MLLQLTCMISLHHMQVINLVNSWSCIAPFPKSNEKNLLKVLIFVTEWNIINFLRLLHKHYFTFAAIYKLSLWQITSRIIQLALEKRWIQFSFFECNNTDVAIQQGRLSMLVCGTETILLLLVSGIWLLLMHFLNPRLQKA